MKVISFYFLIHAPLFWKVSNSDELCKKCTCSITEYSNEQKVVVNCTNSGVNDENMNLLQSMPIDTEVLLMDSNNITMLPSNVFGENKNFTSLKVIDLSKNKIREIKGKAFHHAPLLRILILDHNLINLSYQHSRMFSNFELLEHLHLTDAFSGMQSADLASNLHSIFKDSNLIHLKELHLEQNDITTFADSNVFCDLQALQRLYLGNNNIRKLNFNLSCLKNLYYLDLQNNDISSFTENNFIDFDTHLSASVPNFEINLLNNFFECDCQKKEFFKWMHITHVHVLNNNSLTCKNNKYFNYFHERECIGKSKFRKQDKSLQKIINYIFYSSMSVLIMSFIYKTLLKRCRKRNESTKIQYVVVPNSIDNCEVHL